MRTIIQCPEKSQKQNSLILMMHEGHWTLEAKCVHEQGIISEAVQIHTRHQRALRVRL